jgi:prolyl oligopeptidase
MSADGPYPRAPRSDLTEVLHGRRVEDPFRSLEDPDDPETIAWSAAQDEFYRRQRDGWSTLPHWRSRLEALLETGEVTPPRTFGQYRFFTRRRPRQDQPALVVADGTEIRILFDPLSHDPTGATVLDTWAPSWEGTRVAIQVSSRGTEDSSLWIVDTASGAFVDGPIGRMRSSSIAWLPGAGAFYYVRCLPPEHRPEQEARYHRRVWLHEIGSHPNGDGDALVFGEGRGRTRFYRVQTSRDGRLLAISSTVGTSPGTDVWVADLTAGHLDRPVFTPIQEGVLAEASVYLQHGGIYLCTREGAPYGRVDLVDSSRPSARCVIVPETPGAVIQDFAVLDGPALGKPLALVTRTRHAVSEISVHDLETGEKSGEVELPGRGTVGPVRVGAGTSDEAWFSYTDYVTAPTVLRFDGRTLRTQCPDRDNLAGPDVPGLMVEHVRYPSRDGTEVRMFVVSRAGRPDRPRPTLLSGYGGFGMSIVPGYAAQAVAWAQAGGVYVFACLRGGGEEGDAWHEAGRRARKQNTFDDLTAAADYLVAEGWTEPELLGLVGSSNGGLTVGAALTQHPSKYAAVACVAPLLDMVRYERFGLGPSWIGEYGTVEKQDEFEVLLGYSPYHHIRAGERYPAVLFGIADGDTRVDGMHARKMCAALQEASSSDRPIMLRRESGLGHGARGIAATTSLFAEILAFADATLRVPFGVPAEPTSSEVVADLQG